MRFLDSRWCFGLHWNNSAVASLYAVTINIIFEWSLFAFTYQCVAKYGIELTFGALLRDDILIKTKLRYVWATLLAASSISLFKPKQAKTRCHNELGSQCKTASTFFNTVHLLPGGAKLVSCPGRHLTSVRPWLQAEVSCKIQQIDNNNWLKLNRLSLNYKKTRSVTSLGHHGGRIVFWERPKFFKSCPIVVNYVQHICRGGETSPLVTRKLNRICP